MKKLYLLLISLIVGTHIQSAGALTTVDMLRPIPVPVFGHYYSTGYHLMGGETGVPKHCRIDRDQATHLTPHAVAVATGAPEFYLSIVGTRGRKVHDHARAALDTVSQVPQPWNVLFHGWSGIANNTADMVNMGVFDVQGIQPQDLGRNALKPLQVHPHGVYCSPNNAKFIADPVDAQFMTFGLVGSYQERSIVVYQIVINNDPAQDIIERIHDTPTGDFGTPATLLAILNAPDFRALFAKADDQTRLQKTIAKLQQITGGGDVAAAGFAIGGAAAAVFHPDEIRRQREAAAELADALALIAAMEESDGGAAAALRPIAPEEEDPEYLAALEASAALAQVSDIERARLEFEAIEKSRREAAQLEQAELEHALAQIAATEELERALALSEAMERERRDVRPPGWKPPIAPRRRAPQPATEPDQPQGFGVPDELARVLERRRRMTNQ